MLDYAPPGLALDPVLYWVVLVLAVAALALAFVPFWRAPKSDRLAGLFGIPWTLIGGVAGSIIPGVGTAIGTGIGGLLDGSGGLPSGSGGLPSGSGFPGGWGFPYPNSGGSQPPAPPVEDKTPLYILGGIGALVAVMLLKD